MASLKQIDIDAILDLFEGSKGRGYVLEFSDRTFVSFMRDEASVDIDASRYRVQGNSKGRRLRAFLADAPEPTIVKVLNGLWLYRQRYVADGRYKPVTDGGDDLARIVRSILGVPVDGMGKGHTKPKTSKDVDAGPSPEVFSSLSTEFFSLTSLEPQPRGYAFEKLLRSMFDAWGLDAQPGWRNTGEQIDGSFVLGDSVYFLEAKWRNEQANAADLNAFQGKLEAGPIWTRGLFVSYSGFTADGLKAFASRRVVLMDGLDVHDVLYRRLSLPVVLLAKVRRFSEKRRPFVAVRDLFPS